MYKNINSVFINKRSKLVACERESESERERVRAAREILGYDICRFTPGRGYIFSVSCFFVLLSRETDIEQALNLETADLSSD